MEQRSVEESNGWIDYIRDFVELAESRPLGFLVVMLIIAVVWLVRRLDRVVKDREQIAHALLHAKDAGHDIDETTQRVLKTLDRRTELDRKIKYYGSDMRKKNK